MQHQHQLVSTLSLAFFEAPQRKQDYNSRKYNSNITILHDRDLLWSLQAFNGLSTTATIMFKKEVTVWTLIFYSSSYNSKVHNMVYSDKALICDHPHQHRRQLCFWTAASIWPVELSDCSSKIYNFFGKRRYSEVAREIWTKQSNNKFY